MNDFETFLNAYIACLFWSSTDCDSDLGDDNFQGYEDELSEESYKKIESECKHFWENSSVQEAINSGENTASRAGHDFCLTRNGHGAGFWDGAWKVFGDQLTKESKTYGETNLYRYRGDDQKPYVYVD